MIKLLCIPLLLTLIAGFAIAAGSQRIAFERDNAILIADPEALLRNANR